MSQNKDIFRNLKYIGYCWSQLPPEEAGTNLDDFVRFCKFQLCKYTHTLLKDPIWDSYEDEEIIAEYYAHIFNVSEEERNKLLASLQGLNNDIYDWLDEQIAKNQEKLKDKSEELDDGFSFTPDSLGEE